MALKKWKKHEKLQVLASYLRKVKDENWSGGVWGATKGKKATWSCKSKGCALGHATQVPEFQGLGLELSLDFYDADEKHTHFEVRYKNNYAEFAGAKFFGITQEQASKLFISNALNSISARSMAYKIDKFVNEQRLSA